MDFSEQSTSVWKDARLPLTTTPLRSSIATDVCIIGAGIAGLSVAYELAHGGVSVVVLDDNAIGGGETAQSTAHVASALDDRFHVLERLHGADGARLAYESHDAAITHIGQICERENIDCGYKRVDGYLFLGSSAESVEALHREARAARRAGFGDVEMCALPPRRAFTTGPCLRFPRQAQLDPLVYVEGLAHAVMRRGGSIYTGTHANEIHGDGHGAGSRVVTSDGHVVLAGSIVVATNTPVSDRFAIHTKQAAYRTFVIAAEIPSDVIEPALFWDTADPYHYVRIARRPKPLAREDGAGQDVFESTAEQCLLIVGGEDVRTGHPDDSDDRFERLEAWTRERCPVAGPVVHRWSGQIIEPLDGLAFIGRDPAGPPNVYVVTGDSGNGITHGAIAGMLIGDLVLGRANEWEQLYEPSRKPLRALKRYAQINAATAASYADWLKLGSHTSLDELPVDSGAVMTDGARRLAVYRATDGALHVCSAVCPHLGGLVRWNAAERSWDCPCHGSRFSPDGEVLNGPALHGLKVSELPGVTQRSDTRKRVEPPAVVEPLSATRTVTRR